MRIDDIRKKKGAALILWNPAKKLTANQGMQFRIFIYRLIDTNQQALRFQLREVGLQVEARRFDRNS